MENISDDEVICPDHRLSLSSLDDLDFDVKSYNCSKSSSFNETLRSQDKYIVTSESIGQGAFAKVVLGFSKTSNERVAIKKIDKRITQEKNLLERVQSEATIHLQVSEHRNVVKFKDLFEDEYFLYFVLELCEYGDLRSYISKRNKQKNCCCTESELRQFMYPIIEVLYLLHQNNIVHRDLSLSNVLITKDLKCKLSDFGLAVKLNDKENGLPNRAFCGTPNYIAPEVIKDKIYRKESDVWSFGVMFYTLLAGKEPFDDGGDKSNTFKNILGMKLQCFLPENISIEAKQLINNILCLDPNKRLTAKEIYEHGFFSNGKKDICTPVRSSEISLDSGRDTLSSVSRQYRPSIYTETPESVISEISQITSVATSKNRSKPEKISTLRLKSIKSKNKDAVVQINKNGEVCLEVQRRNGRGYDALKISSNGDKLFVYTSKTSFSDHDEDNCLPSTYKEYSYDNMPTKYWARYAYAWKFVKIVRSGTPKVTVYTDTAKCKLMESLDDFEAIFQDGTKISGNLSEENIIRIIESDGRQYKQCINNDNEIPLKTKDKWVYVCNLLKECRFIETCFRSKKSNFVDYFPIRVGANSFVSKSQHDVTSSACF